MSKRPFYEFLKKLQADPALSKKVYDAFMRVFDGHELTPMQIKALCSGRKELVEEALREEGGEPEPYFPHPLFTWWT